MSERAVIVIEFDIPDGDTFGPMLKSLHEWLDDRTPPRQIYGAIKGDARRVLDVFDPEPTHESEPREEPAT